MANPIKANPLVALDALQRLNLSFPDDVETYHTHHIIFTVYKTKREARTAPDKTTPIAIITLPMTQELQVSYHAGYGGTDLGSVGSTVESALEGLSASSGKNAEEMLQTVKRNITAIATSPTQAIKEIAGKSAAVGGSAVLQFLGGAGPIGQGALAGIQAFGVARNPHKAVLFEGTDFRSHSFSFRLSPVTASESDAIRNIIALFKYHMHPGYAGAGSVFGQGNHFFSTPDFFKIQLSNQGSYTVNDYQICVLKGMTVNYQPSNYPAYARVTGSNPAPMEVIMNLEFQETAIITKEDIGNPYTEDARDLKLKTQMPKNPVFSIIEAVNDEVGKLTNEASKPTS